MDSSLNLNEKINFSPDGKKVVVITAERTIRLFRADPKSWLQTACNRLRYHPIFSKPTTDIDREAKATCEQHVWRNSAPFESSNPEISSPLQVREPLSLETLSQTISTATAPALAVSPSPSSYKFEFPKAKCGDESSTPNAPWYPVFIDNRSIGDIQKQYCGDAKPVTKWQKTGKPSVLVASFSDRQKAEAFAQKVSGEVGEP